MTNTRSSMSTLTDDEIQEHHRVIFQGLTRATWEQLQDFSKMNVRAQQALRTSNPSIECALPYGTAEEKDAVRGMLRSMSLLLPEKAFSYHFNDPLQPDKAVLSLHRSHANYFNDIRANYLDDQLDALFLRIRDNLKDPAFGTFLQLGSRNENTRMSLRDMQHDLIDAINLYHSDSVPMPKSDVVWRTERLRDAIERKDNGELYGPMWVVEYNLSMGRYDRKEAEPALQAAKVFEHNALALESVARTLKELGAGAWKE